MTVGTNADGSLESCVGFLGATAVSQSSKDINHAMMFLLSDPSHVEALFLANAASSTSSWPGWRAVSADELTSADSACCLKTESCK